MRLASPSGAVTSTFSTSMRAFPLVKGVLDEMFDHALRGGIIGRENQVVDTAPETGQHLPLSARGGEQYPDGFFDALVAG